MCWSYWWNQSNHLEKNGVSLDQRVEVKVMG